MSRSRNIKPGFFKNDVLVALPFEYRILFIGLWTLADRDGRLEDRPMRIKMELFAADDVDVSAGLDALHSAGFITRYVVDSSRFIAVNAWAKHQNPHVKEASSCIPAPGKHSACTVPALPIPERAGLIPDSLNLIPDSLTKHVQPAAARSRFDEFWSLYPEKKGKQPAKKAWERKRLDPMADEIIAHVRMMLSEDDDWKRGYAPHGSTYINAERWTDEPKRARMAQTAQPSKRLQGIMKLEAMKNGLDSAGSGNGAAKAFLPRIGEGASGRFPSGDGDGLG